jgi:hypothetical protein
MTRLLNHSDIKLIRSVADGKRFLLVPYGNFALECSTRAAAALKASSMGLLPLEPTGLVSKAISYRSDNSI